MRMAVFQIFGGAPQVTAAADAVAAFIKDPKSLETVAKSAKGLSAADFPLLENPPELVKRLDIKATANQ